MVEKEILISNATGLHARPASDFILEAKKFQSAVTIQKKGEGVPLNGKSIMKVLSLGVVQGDTVILTASGADEEACLKALVSELENQKD
jgi:phosphocarrier protein HPr